MKIGSWEVTQNGIEWKGSGLNRFVIDKKGLTEEIETDDENLSLYKWIVLATEEDWLTEDDLYDLNFAFVYAAAQWGATFDYQMFDETLSYQYSQLEDEENEQPDDSSSDDDDLAALEQQRKEAESERD
ncbi:MAG: hypothetical protein EOO00_05715 [Chitinophagaceae bacterium]|nr:MAG: hypothetical protein EOO00_05715 [Chitinophagaceae bacterium]